LLVMIGVRADGRKELIALSDGYRESTESWADLLRDCKRRGMRAPVLAVGDGALGFWASLGEVFPQARAQRCWFHRSRQEIRRCFVIFGSLRWYGDLQRGPRPTRAEIR
ncbi:transposase, partial [Microbispora sp. CSR-4]|uniref:transposase n=1 Tax=Microbispora sp. CSR-4 TaxID=2592813 RepID=UPI0021C6F5A8